MKIAMAAIKPFKAVVVLSLVLPAFALYSTAATLTGTTGKNKIYGTAGSDTIYGKAGNDKLYGKAGNDKIYGGAGHDILYGHRGRDILTGGSGIDTFIWLNRLESRTGKGSDVITDFDAAAGEVIDLSRVDAKKIAGRQQFIWIGGKAFSGIQGQLRFARGHLKADTNGDRKADFAIKVVVKKGKFGKENLRLGVSAGTATAGFPNNAIWPFFGVNVSNAQDTYGPRIKSGGFSFHKGIDIPKPQNTPIIAILNGYVEKVTEKFDDNHIQYRVEVKHLKTNGSGYFYSSYNHLNTVSVSEGETIQQGETIGLSGYDSSTDFPHLHFEIRDKEYYSKNAVHPLRVLPYSRSSPKSKVTISEPKNLADSALREVTGTVVMEARRQDIYKAELLIYDNKGDTIANNDVLISTLGSYETTYDFELQNLKEDIDGGATNLSGGNLTVKPVNFGSGDPQLTMHFEFTKFATALPSGSNTTLVFRATNIQGETFSAPWIAPISP